MGKFRALSTVQTFVVKSMSSPVEKWMTKGSVSSLPPLHNPSGVESGIAAQKLANDSQQWRHNEIHWTHSQGGSSGLCNLKGEKASQEETNLWKTRGCEGVFCAFLSSAGVSWWPRAGVVLLWLFRVCETYPTPLELDFQGMLSLLCLWNPAEVTVDVTSQLWLPKPMAENRKEQVCFQGYPGMFWAASCWHCGIALGRAALFAGVCPLCGWISSCSVSSCLNLSCQELIMA